MRRAIALAAVVGCLGLGCRAVVLTGLDDAQAGEAVAALDAARIAARAEREPGADRDAFRLEVPQAEVARALAALHAARLPQRPAAGLDALERGAGLVPTPEQERGRLALALAGELSRSLSRLPGVVEARVHVSPPAARTALDRAPGEPTAGVLLLRAHGAAPVPEPAVRELVAAAIAGLRPEAVAIVQSEVPRARVLRPTVVAVGPISVARESAGPLRALLAGALLLHAVLAAALIAVVARRRARSTPAPDLRPR
jgi:type III secretion protein J